MGRIGIGAALAAGVLASACETTAPASQVDETTAAVVETGPTVRFAQFNISFYRDAEGALIEDLRGGQNAQAQAVAEIIRRVRPDVILLNEFDYDAAGEGVEVFQDEYLAVGDGVLRRLQDLVARDVDTFGVDRTEATEPIRYRYVYLAPSNTGEPSGFDLNNDGITGGALGTRDHGNDSFGFGTYPGQYSFAVLSRFPIDEGAIRTYRKTRWIDVPGAVLPDDPTTNAPADWYSTEELEVFRLSSKNHAMVPILIDDARVNLVASHPTPPGFDGQEDRNGKRNFDENRLSRAIVENADWLVDDAGRPGGVTPGEAFIIAGDLNAAPRFGSGVPGAIEQLLDHPAIDASLTPTRLGVLRGDPVDGCPGDATHRSRSVARGTSDRVCDLRLDYVLPSKAGLETVGGGVFWPAPDDPLFRLVGDGADDHPSSDHRLVWVDVRVTQ